MLEHRRQRITVIHATGRATLDVAHTGGGSTWKEKRFWLLEGEWPTDEELAYLADAGQHLDGTIRRFPEHFGRRVRDAGDGSKIVTVDID